MVFAPSDAAPSRAFWGKVAVFHFFLGLPFTLIAFMSLSPLRSLLHFVPCQGLTLVSGFHKACHSGEGRNPVFSLPSKSMPYYVLMRAGFILKVLLIFLPSNQHPSECLLKLSGARSCLNDKEPSPFSLLSFCIFCDCHFVARMKNPIVPTP